MAPAYQTSLDALFPGSFDDYCEIALWARDNAGAVGGSGDIILTGNSAYGGSTDFKVFPETFLAMEESAPDLPHSIEINRWIEDTLADMVDRHCGAEKRLCASPHRRQVTP